MGQNTCRVCDNGNSGNRRKAVNEFTIIVDRRSGGSLGIDATPENDGTLAIAAVSPDGLVDRWNKQLPTGSPEVVKAGMKLIDVNNNFGDSMKLVEACKAKEVLRITLRPAATITLGSAQNGLEEGAV
eukprot:TRINITY_DN13528_c0_g1_i1.p2 TRINITY_DN13528_c0_g1~~TRINITY_DN13528_c0_g1_i1.p2  ORF type:complete len:128 (+),score=30.30 TRINITY_DN13528_c0_g1_i1:60-443(+)